jgi:hypothetical protein
LTTVRFDHPAQQIVLQDYIDAVIDAERRVYRVTRQITEHLPGWSMAPVATAIQAMRGVALINRRNDRGGDRRLSTVRQPAAIDGLSWPGSIGAFEWQRGTGAGSQRPAIPTRDAL